MLYSWMNEGNFCYVNLHAEEVLRKHGSIVGIRTDGGQEETENLSENMQKETCDVFAEMLKEAPQKHHMLVDFDGFGELTEETAGRFGSCMEELLRAENRICLLSMTAQAAGRAKEELTKRGISCDFFAHKDEPACFWGCVGEGSGACGKEAEMPAKADDIIKSNLFILMGEGPKGKRFDLPRIIGDGELCAYYFFYCLAQRLIKAGLVSADETANRNICFVPDNAEAVIMAEALAGLLGTGAILQYPATEALAGNQDYIIVRDVLHMGCEPDGLSAAIVGVGAEVKGVACLVDIHTGIGKVKNKVSLHTINLERGILHR